MKFKGGISKPAGRKLLHRPDPGPGPIPDPDSPQPPPHPFPTPPIPPEPPVSSLVRSTSRGEFYITRWHMRCF